MARPKNSLPFDNINIKKNETLGGKDFRQFTSDVIRAKSDPIWFLKERVDWKPFPMQEQIIRTFYQDKYDPSLPEYKKLIVKAGQRCISRYSLILTLEYGQIKIEDLYDKIYSDETIHVKNRYGWTRVTEAYYTGFKKQYRLATCDGKWINCSIDHKFFVNDKWIALKDIKSNDKILCFDLFNQKYYETSVLGWDEEEYTIEMYDLHVPEGNCYVVNGMLSHNSGKSVMGSKIGVYEFFELATCSFTQTPAEYFGTDAGQEIGISCVSAGKDQALKNIFGIMKRNIKENEWFNQWFDISVTENEIKIRDKNIYVMVGAAKADTGAATGNTSKAVFGDEVDLWQRTDSKAGAEIVWSKLVNSTQTLGIDGKCIAISSTQYPDGMISRLYNAGIREKTTLTYDLPTWEMNPKISRESLESEFKYRMEQFYRDFANQPNVSGGLQFPEKVKLDRTIKNVLQTDFETNPVLKGRVYPHVMAIDPAWRNDSFGIGCGYLNNGEIIIDGVRKFQKANKDEEYIRPSDIRNFIVPAIKALNVDAFIYDTDLTPELVEYIDDELGAEVIKHIVTKEDYDRWRELQDGGFETSLRVVYDDFLETECNQLIVQVTDTGRRKTNHTQYSSKDVADTVANCIWYLEGYMPEYNFTPLGTTRFV